MRRGVVALTALGLLVRVAWWWHADVAPVSDFEYTRRLSESILAHHQYGFPEPVAGRVPVFPLWLALLMTVSHSIAWLSLVNAAVSTAMVPLTASLTRRLGYGEPVALVAAAICAVYPNFVFFAPVLATEPLFLLLLVLACILTLRLRTVDPSRQAVHATAAGLLYGAAVLTRVDALFFLPAVAALIGRAALRRAVVAGLVLGTAIVVTPWYVRNRLVIGSGTGLSTTGGVNFYYAHNAHAYGWHPVSGTPLEGLSPVEMQQRGYALGFEYLASAGWTQIAGDVLTGTIRLFGPSGYPYGLFWSTRLPGATPDDFTERPLSGLAFFTWLTNSYAVLLIGAIASGLLWRRHPRGARVLYGFVAMNWVGNCVIFWADPRFRYVSEFVFCILTAFVVIEALRLLRRTR